jgi:hypothetical protein
MMNVDIRGAVTYRGSWGAFGQLRDVMDVDTNDLSLLGGQTLDVTRNLNMTLVFPGRLDVGTFTIGRYTPGVLPAGAAAYVEVDTLFFASLPGGSLTVSAANYPPRPGLDFGMAYGTMAFRAVRLVAGPGGGGAPVTTADTVDIRISFAARWYHYLRPNVTISLTGGGPVLGTSLVTVAQSVDDDHGGRFVDWESDFDRAPGQGIPYEISAEFRLAAPAAGTFTLAATPPRDYRDPARWPAAYAVLFYRDDPRIALSTGGTLTVTRFVAPTDAYYGEIHGTLTAPLALWANDTTVTADTVQVTATFAVQLWPLGGIPASTFRRESPPNPLAAPEARNLLAPRAPGPTRPNRRRPA